MAKKLVKNALRRVRSGGRRAPQRSYTERVHESLTEALRESTVIRPVPGSRAREYERISRSLTPETPDLLAALDEGGGIEQLASVLGGTEDDISARLAMFVPDVLLRYSNDLHLRMPLTSDSTRREVAGQMLDRAGFVEDQLQQAWPERFGEPGTPCVDHVLGIDGHLRRFGDEFSTADSLPRLVVPPLNDYERRVRLQPSWAAYGELVDIAPNWGTDAVSRILAEQQLDVMHQDRRLRVLPGDPRIEDMSLTQRIMAYKAQALHAYSVESEETWEEYGSNLLTTIKRKWVPEDVSGRYTTKAFDVSSVARSLGIEHDDSRGSEHFRFDVRDPQVARIEETHPSPSAKQILEDQRSLSVLAAEDLASRLRAGHVVLNFSFAPKYELLATNIAFPPGDPYGRYDQDLDASRRAAIDVLLENGPEAYVGHFDADGRRSLVRSLNGFEPGSEPLTRDVQRQREVRQRTVFNQWRAAAVADLSGENPARRIDRDPRMSGIDMEYYREQLETGLGSRARGVDAPFRAAEEVSQMAAELESSDESRGLEL